MERNTGGLGLEEGAESERHVRVIDVVESELLQQRVQRIAAGSE